MEALLSMLARRLRPQIGWFQFTLALAAVLCAAFAAGAGTMKLPSSMFGWASAAGLVIALRLGRLRPRVPGWPARTLRSVWAGLLGLALLAIGAVLVVAAAGTLPPLGLITEDLAAYIAWLWAALRGTAGWAEQPEAHALPYFAITVVRFWHSLLAAPTSGNAGARLIVLAGGIAASWGAALLLGWGLARGHNLFGWGLPTLGAVAFIAMLGGSSGVELIFALALLLVLLIVTGARRRERSWEATGADYSDDLRNDALIWGSYCIVLVIVLAIAIPNSVNNPIADLFWRDVELPSGIAALERNIPRPQRAPAASIGISQLPVLSLDQSLEQAPPEKVILRMRLGAPLPASPWPHYWRARVFNFYNGHDWTTNARVSEFASGGLQPEAVPGSILQNIEDLRNDRSIVVALPDIITTDLAAQSERLPDGSLAALTIGASAERYQVLSRPQEQAAPPASNTPPPDLSSYLVLPKNYLRVPDLARAVVGVRTSPYEQALALERFLRGLPYSYSVQPIPPTGDAVEQFLFDMRQGYCTYYASAMAMMARSLGIPARLAIGYATGEYDQATGSYQVRQADAHAWPELYIDGRWLPFEPTPIRSLPARTSAAPEFPTPLPAVAAPAEQPSDTRGPWIWALALAVVATASTLLWWRGRARSQPVLAVEIQRQLEQSGARAGVPWPTGATLREYGQLLAPKASDSAHEIAEVTELLGEARYSGQPLRTQQEGRLRALAERVLARLAQLRRR